MTKEQIRINNIVRLQDHAFDHCQQNGTDLAKMDRKVLSEILYEFSIEAGISYNHFQQAYAQTISELNNTPSTILQSNQKHTIMKKVKPLLPLELQILDKQDDEDEPTQRQRITPRYQKVEPYISPMLRRAMKGGQK